MGGKGESEKENRAQAHLGISAILIRRCEIHKKKKGDEVRDEEERQRNLIIQ